MAELHLPPTLPSLFEDLPRTVEVDGATVAEAIERLDGRWPGMRDRLCEPGPVLRKCASTSGERRMLIACFGAAALGRPRRTSFPPSYTSAWRKNSSVSF